MPSGGISPAEPEKAILQEKASAAFTAGCRALRGAHGFALRVAFYYNTKFLPNKGLRKNFVQNGENSLKHWDSTKKLSSAKVFRADNRGKPTCPKHIGRRVFHFSNKLPYKCKDFLGQASTHEKHKMHSVPFNRLRELSETATFIGQTFSHFPQEMHLSVSFFTRSREK